jgi:MarR family transcriptional regulator, transcriptional regulator for hemolysin
MFNLLRTFGFLLKDVTDLYVRRFEQRVGALGLTLLQCRVLVGLVDHEGISQSQLAELTGIDPATLVRILDRTESDGWLERRNDPTDCRTQYLYTKAKIKSLFDDIRHLADLTCREAFAGIPKKHAALMTELLAKIQSNFTSLEPRQPMPAVAPLQSGRASTGAARNRRERTSFQP